MKQNPTSMPFWHPITLIVTCFGVGKIPFAPGTFGSVAGLGFLALKCLFLIGIGLSALDMPIDQQADTTNFLIAYYALLATVTVVGLWATHEYMKRTRREDPKEVVVDEVIGVIIAYEIWGNAMPWDLPLLSPNIYEWLLLAIPFLLFRLFDILKPGPVGWADKNMKGTWGVMLDDLIAGVLAGLASIALFYLVF